MNEGMEKRQREFMLRQQMDALRKELGEDDGDVAGRVPGPLAELHMPAAVREAVEREIDRLERTGEQSPEHGWIRTWLDTLTELPWGKRSDDRLDLTEARAILDADHTGLDDVKERIVEHLAVRKLRKDRGLDEVRELHLPPSADTTAPPGAGRAPSSSWSALPASARPRSASRWPAPSAGSSSGWPSAACGTRPRSAATAAPTSAPSRAASCGP